MHKLTEPDQHANSPVHSIRNDAWMRALAATITRLSRLANEEGRVINPISHGMTNLGELTDVDRFAMALTSAALIQAGEPDVAAEIHELLFYCTKPFGEWCPGAVPDDRKVLRLIDPDLLQPTKDCWELAKNYSGFHADLEEQLFEQLNQELHRLNLGLEAEADAYSRIREWVVRHPVATFDEIRAMLMDRGLAAMADLITGDFYRPITYEEAPDGFYLCGYCGMRMRPRVGGDGLHCPIWICRLRAPHRVGERSEWKTGLYEARGALQMYWIGPGLDEIDLYDYACQQGIDAELYPDKDACDVLLPDGTGVDIKCYQSPFLLASRLNKGIGRLGNYRRRIVAVGDYLLDINKDYLEQLTERLDTTPSVEVMPMGRLKSELRA